MEVAFVTGLARCSRCKIMYDQGAAKQQCRYHPGTFQLNTANCGTLKPQSADRWSCCQRDGEDAPGCRTDDEHVRCEATNAALEHFPQQQTGDTTTGLRRRAAATGTATRCAPSSWAPSRAGCDGSRGFDVYKLSGYTNEAIGVGYMQRESVK